MAGLAAVGVLVTVVGTGSVAGAAKKPTTGGTLTFIHSREVASLDPIVSTGATNVQIGDIHQFGALYDVLVYESLSGEVKNRVAKSFTSTDAKVWTLTIRDGVKFSDGTVYDAAAVKFNWERYKNPANRFPQAAGLANIVSMEVTAPQVLKITLTEPYGQFPRQVARSFPLVASPTAIQTKGAALGRAPVGAGPFLFKEWVTNGSLTLTRNPNYWDSPKPYLDTLIITQVPDADQRFNTFAAGGADIVGVGSQISLQAKVVAAKYKYQEVLDPVAGSYFAFNMRRSPFNDVLARRAVAHAMDTKRMTEVIYQGVTAPPKTLIPKSSPLYAKGSELVTYDKKAAQKELDEYAQKYGKPLEFTMTSLSTQELELKFFQTQLSAFKNIIVKLDFDVAANFVTRLTTGNFDMMTAAISGYDPEPDVYNHYFTKGLRNYQAYSDPEMDAALTKGRTSLNVKERAAAYKTVQQLVERDVPEVYWRPTVAFFMIGPKVRGAKLSPCCFFWSDVWKTAA